MWTEEVLLDDLTRTTDPDFALQNILMIGFIGILLLIIMIAVYDLLVTKVTSFWEHQP